VELLLEVAIARAAGNITMAEKNNLKDNQPVCINVYK
jgi:hypothetical protein